MSSDLNQINIGAIDVSDENSSSQNSSYNSGSHKKRKGLGLKVTTSNLDDKDIDSSQKDISLQLNNAEGQFGGSPNGSIGQMSNNGEPDAPVFLDEYNDVYASFKPVDLLIEGPEPDSDFSYFLVNLCDDLKDCEKGMPLKDIGKEIESRDQEMEYRLLMRMNCHKLQYQNLVKSQEQSFKNKNRYKDILPFKHSIVKLETPSDQSESFADYINANYINTAMTNESGKKAFIAAMAPTEHSAKDFWTMVFENYSSLIIMLCPESEGTKEMSTKYYEGKEPLSALDIGEFTIQPVSCKEKFQGLFVRKLKVSQSGLVDREITHIQETLWDDNTRPDKKEGLNMFERVSYILKKMKKHKMQDTQCRPIVHCSAGCGRTGSLLAIYILVESIEQQIQKKVKKEDFSMIDPYYNWTEDRISVFGVVRRLREQRWSLVKTHDQYQYVYAFIKEWCSKNNLI